MNKIIKEVRTRFSRGKSSDAKKIVLAVDTHKPLYALNRLPSMRLIHPNVCLSYALDVLDAINPKGQLETNAIWKFEFNTERTLLAYTNEYPHFRKKLLTDVLRGLVYIHQNYLAHGGLVANRVYVIQTDNGPKAVITFSDMFKKDDLDLYQHEDLINWGKLVCEVYTGKPDADLLELPVYMQRFVETCFKSELPLISCNASSVLEMIEEENAQKEIDVQLASISKAKLTGLYNRLEKKYAHHKSPKGLASNFNEFRRY